MPPPLITDYKKRFVYKRLVETLLGGPKLFSPVVFIILQVTIFTIPAIIVSLVNFGNDDVTDWKWRSIFTGCSVFLVDVCLSLVIILIKRGRNNVAITPVTAIEQTGDGNNGSGNPVVNLQSPSIQIDNSAFLAEEDVITRQGCLKSSTWDYIAPNVTLSLGYMFAVTLSSLSFGFCTPLMLSNTIHPVLRGFGIFAMCNARYSSVINSPPEVATFDAIDRRHFCYRPFYTLVLVGGWYFSAVTFPADTNEGTYLLVPFSVTLACLPILWTLGILPPLDCVFPWLLETLLKLTSGSSPSYYYFGTVISLFVVIVCPILVFIISQEPLVIILVECFCGYITSCDTGRIVSLKPALCEDTPTKSFLVQLVHPLLIIFTSLICVLITWLNASGVSSFDSQVSFSAVALIVSILSWIFRQSTIARKVPLAKTIVFPVSILHGLLAFLLHIWLTLSIKNDKNEWSSIVRSSDLHSLERLVPYLLTIRAFSLSISEPRKSSIDFSLTFIWKQYWEGRGSSFVLILFIISLITRGIKRFLKHLKTACSICYSFGISTILPSKFHILGAAVAFSPISIISLILSTIVEGATMTSVFSLPIFFLGFPRPSSFWSERWFPKSKDKNQIVLDVESLDWKIYAEIGHLLAGSLSRKAHAARLKLHAGDCFLARYDERLLFIRILSKGWNFNYIQIKGLEMQEQTSCHHQEAAKVDEHFERVFGEENVTCLGKVVNPFTIGILTPILSLKIPTYSESKSKISILKSNEDRGTFKDMFYRSFSYLWIKNNPALKGESYQRLLNKKGLQMLSSSPTPIGNPTDTTKEFSINNALFKSTAPHVKFISAEKTIKAPDPRSRSSSVISGIQNAAFEGDESLDDPLRTFSRQSSRSTLLSPTTTTRILSMQSTGVNEKSVSNSDRLNSIWIKQCVGDIIPPNAVKARVEKLCRGVWDTVLGPDEDKDIDLSEFFQENFVSKLKTLATSRKVDMQDIALKAFRYAAKLALDEIYSSACYASNSKVITLDAETEEELFSQLTLYERDYQFCTQQEISMWIQQNTNHIITIVRNTGSDQNQENQCVMRILNYETEGVEFRVGQLDQLTVEGLWSNINLELLYFTSDDDERFSIQNDRILLRNIVTQCAKTPLGYPVYDAVFRVNLFNFSVSQVE